MKIWDKLADIFRAKQRDNTTVNYLPVKTHHYQRGRHAEVLRATEDRKIRVSKKRRKITKAARKGLYWK